MYVFTSTFLFLFFLDLSGTRESCGFFTHLTDVIKSGLGRYFSGRPDLKIIAEPGTHRREGVREGGCD